MTGHTSRTLFVDDRQIQLNVSYRSLGPTYKDSISFLDNLCSVLTSRLRSGAYTKDKIAFMHIAVDKIHKDVNSTFTTIPQARSAVGLWYELYTISMTGWREDEV